MLTMLLILSMPPQAPPLAVPPPQAPPVLVSVPLVAPPVTDGTTLTRIPSGWDVTHPSGTYRFGENWTEGQIREYLARQKVEPKPVAVNPAVTPAVVKPAKASTFPYDPDHTCDKCGRYVTRIAGYLSNGSHYHNCPCGNTWQHK